MSVAGPLPFPKVTGVREGRRGVGVGRGIGGNINRKSKLCDAKDALVPRPTTDTESYRTGIAQ